MNVFEKIILFFLFLLPFQFALHPTEGIDLALIRVFAIIIFLFWVARSFWRKQFILSPPRILFFFSSYVVWVIISLLWAENTDWALRKALFVLSFWPLFVLFFAFLREQTIRERAYKFLSAGAILIASVGTLQFFGQFIFGTEKTFTFWTQEILPFFLGPNFGAAVAAYPSLLVNISGSTLMRAIGFFPDPHMLSFFLGMALPLTLAFGLKTVSRERIIWMTGAGIIFVTDLLTFSRGGYVGLFCGMSIFFLALLLRSPKWKQLLVRGVFLGGLMVSVVFFTPIGTRFFSTFSQSDGSNIERLRLWQEATVFIGEHPFLGSGIGNYSLSVKPTASYREPIYVHNLYLDVAVELGITGLFFFGGFLLLGILSAWRKWQREGNLSSLALLSALILFSTHAIFETPLFSVQVLPFFLFLIAASVL